MATITAPSYPKLAVSCAAAAAATAAALQSKDSILNRRSCGYLGYKPSIVAFNLCLRSKDLGLNRLRSGYPENKQSVVAFNSSLQADPVLSTNIAEPGFSTFKQHKHLGASSSQFLGEEDEHIGLAALPSQFFGDDVGNLRDKVHILPKRRRSLCPPRAYKDDIFQFRYPTITEKPEWWWRTLACVPYLIALQISDVGFFLQPFLEHYETFENLVYFVPGAIRRLPPWFSMIYCYLGYVGIVKNKDWPHFIRFHMMMGMLLETALQLLWCTSNFFPLIHYNGRFGMYYWAAIGFCYIFLLSDCVRSALSGKYAHIPFISDAAFIHTLFNIGGFQRPF